LQSGEWEPTFAPADRHDRFNPTIEIRDVELLVWRVQIIVRESKSHHHGRNAEMLLKISNNRHRSTRANEHRVFAEYFPQGFRRRVYEAVIRIHGVHPPGFSFRALPVGADPPNQQTNYETQLTYRGEFLQEIIYGIL